MSFDTVERNFGDVIHGESPSVELQVTNTGDAVLVLGRIDSYCGCAKGVRGSKDIAPGTSSKIFVQINTKGMYSGLHSKSIVVHSNDPERPLTTIKLNFNVVRNISIEPRTLGLSLAAWGKDAVFALTATNSGTEPVTVKGAKSNNADELQLIPKELIVPSGGKTNFQLSVKVQRQEGKAFISGTALIETTDKREEIVPVRYLIRLPQVSGQ
ncbi:MAG: DUF1573 domain-containing protein [Desulfomonilaceae bacterium]